MRQDKLRTLGRELDIYVPLSIDISAYCFNTQSTNIFAAGLVQ